MFDVFRSFRTPGWTPVLNAQRDMPLFDLVLNISPSFHRHCSIRIEGEVTGVATFEAPARILHPRVVLALPVESEQMAKVHGCCSSMLAGWDESWSRSGLDGIGIVGEFDSSERKPRAFTLWSPSKRSVAHMMLAAALECFPFDRCDGAAGELLEIVRSYFGLQPPVTVINHDPMHIRIAPWVHSNNASEVESSLRLLPEDAELIVDVSGVEHSNQALARILPIGQLLKRSGPVRWIVRQHDFDALIRSGVEPTTIETIHAVPISPHGEPIVLGGICVSSLELIALAKAGERMALVRAFRSEYHLTIEQAAASAKELLDIVARYPLH